LDFLAVTLPLAYSYYRPPNVYNFNQRSIAMIHVVAIITIKPGLRETVLAAFRANIPAVLAEDGCIEYGPTVDTDDVGSFQAKIGADAFMVIEKWRDVAALKAHAAAPHMVAYGAKVKDMLAGRIVHVLSPAG